MMQNHKRQDKSNSDLNNNEIINPRKKISTARTDKQSYYIGQIKELHMINFMCHRNFSIEFPPIHMQIITGANGSGKSTIANAISLCLGAQARTTGRTSNVQSFIRHGETSAQLTITLANEGAEAYKPELYGREIRIIRKIGPRQSSYRILGINRKIVSRRKETVDEIIQALSIYPENPLCVLHQEIAKTFLINSDSQKKYQFYMKASQLDQIKQSYEQGVCTVHLLTQRVNAMKTRHIEMLRELEPYEQEIKKIELRRSYEDKRRTLEMELMLARADKVLQDLLEVKYELEQVQQTKHNIDMQMIETNKTIFKLNEGLDDYAIEKSDLEKDICALNELLSYFTKQQHDLQSKIYSLVQESDQCRRLLTDVELEQIHLQKQIDKYENLNQESVNNEHEHLKVDQEISIRREKQIEIDKIIVTLADEIRTYDENIRDREITIDVLKSELIQKQTNLDELNKIERDRTNVYGEWMSNCLKRIENEPRFHQKPIGPIGRYIQCIDPHWSYAVEKHLASVMPAFICTDNEDESILLEILSSYSFDARPTVYVRAFSDKVYDISGTLERIRKANLRCINDVLKIDNITVQCALIDIKQIEATILIEDLQQAKRIRHSGVLLWEKIDGKVKRVIEAWTHDGSNVKFDKTFRIYTNDRQPIKYFLTPNTKSSSINELDDAIKLSHKMIRQMNASLNESKSVRQAKFDEINQARQQSINNGKKINELLKELERFNSTIPIVIDCSLVELQERLDKCQTVHNDTIRTYDEAETRKNEYLQQLADVKENYESILKRRDTKRHQYDYITEKTIDEQSKRAELEREVKVLKRKMIPINKNIVKFQNKLKKLTKQQSKKPQSSTMSSRSIREIECELDAVNNYLRAHEDTNEQRREVINAYRIKRDSMKTYKLTYERCCEQVERLRKFINKRQEGFLTIAEQHQYYLRVKFQNLMKKYHFDESDILIDHKREQLELIVKREQRNLASLSGGERSISTFCFLLALWESIYQPFRLLDEIDIYMDNEKRSSSLDVLYENTQDYRSSQHIIFTPQAIDSQTWNALNIPVFYMPTPKRSLSEVN